MRIKKILLAFVVTLFCITAYKQTALAANDIIIDDAEDLLSEREESDLYEVMQECSDYGNMIFVTVGSHYGTSNGYAESYYLDYYSKKDDGVLFLIDMSEREIYLYTAGDTSYIITSGHCRSITDNVFKYASNRDYGTCAVKTFEQVNTLLSGGKISQPMKHISNVLIALIAAFIINYFIVRKTSSNKTANRQDLLQATNHRCNIMNPYARMMRESKVYSPRSSGSGGSSGGGGGGGGHSSGGGHHF